MFTGDDEDAACARFQDALLDVAELEILILAQKMAFKPFALCPPRKFRAGQPG
jgi:hypothetical protein